MKWPGYLAIVGGVFLLVGGAAGSALPSFLYEFAAKYMDPGDMKDNVLLVLRIMVFLAALGGLTVIFGGIAITKGLERVGKLLIFLGCALGLMGLILNAIIAVVTNSWGAFEMAMLGMSGMGSMLAIAAYSLA